MRHLLIFKGPICDIANIYVQVESDNETKGLLTWREEDPSARKILHPLLEDPRRRRRDNFSFALHGL